MARIIGAIASSHTPTIGFALDRNKRDDPVWAPIFAAYEPIRAWLAEHLPDDARWSPHHDRPQARPPLYGVRGKNTGRR